MFLRHLLLWITVQIATAAGAQTVLFETGFEDVGQFSGFYITPTGDDHSTQQDLIEDPTLGTGRVHRAWITRARRDSSLLVNRNHRAYPTLQFHKTGTGPHAWPVCVSIDVWADVDLAQRPGEDQWISLATFTDDRSDRWRRTVLLNVSHDGLVHLQHVPLQGAQVHQYQNRDLRLPDAQWVRVEVELSEDQGGLARAWMNGTLVSSAFVRGMAPIVAQAHFGLYAAPTLASGEVRNDNLRVVSGRCHK